MGLTAFHAGFGLAGGLAHLAALEVIGPRVADLARRDGFLEFLVLRRVSYGAAPEGLLVLLALLHILETPLRYGLFGAFGHLASDGAAPLVARERLETVFGQFGFFVKFRTVLHSVRLVFGGCSGGFCKCDALKLAVVFVAETEDAYSEVERYADLLLEYALEHFVTHRPQNLLDSLGGR